MVPIGKIEQGLANYLDAELIPQLQGSGVERVAVGVVASLLIRRTSIIIDNYKDNKLVKMLGVMDDKGNIDVETIVTELKNNIPKEGFSIDIPVTGTLTFHKEDVDTLYKYIMEV